jgi:hypothetical protein
LPISGNEPQYHRVAIEDDEHVGGSKMKRAILLTVVAFLAAGVAFAEQGADPKEVTGADDLVKQKSSQFQDLWVNPDADISKYGKLYLWNTVFQFRDVSDNVVNRTTTAMLRGDQGFFTVPEEDQEKFKELVTDVVVKELGRSKQFEIVDTVGPGTLLLRAAVLDIVSNIPPNVGRQANVHLASMGEATFVFELIDAETGVIQARTADRRYIQPPSAMNTVNAAPTNYATAWNYVELWARDQAMTLRRELDRAAKKAAKK